MTPHAATVQSIQQDSSEMAASAPQGPSASDTRMPEYPRVTEMLQRIRAVTPTTAPATDTPASSHAAQSLPAPQVVGQHAAAPAAGVASMVAASVPMPTHAVSHVAVPSAEATYGGAAVTAPAVPAVPAPPAGRVEPPRAVDVAHLPKQFQHEAAEDDLTDDEIAELIDDLSMRDLAREALRARMIAFGENRHQRSAYEIVFLMLAFSVTVLITTPPLVQLALALHGNQPG